MKAKIRFFEEAEGVKSSTRLNSFLLLIFFMAFNIMWIYGENDISGNLIMLHSLMLVGIFAPKYLHKLAEVALKVKT